MSNKQNDHYEQTKKEAEEELKKDGYKIGRIKKIHKPYTEQRLGGKVVKGDCAVIFEHNKK